MPSFPFLITIFIVFKTKIKLIRSIEIWKRSNIAFYPCSKNVNNYAVYILFRYFDDMDLMENDNINGSHHKLRSSRPLRSVLYYMKVILG
jgi:hypothetical protein